MRTRISSLFLYLPLVAVLVTGCSDQSSPTPAPAKAPVAAGTPTKSDAGAKTSKRAPKNPSALTGPTDLVD